MAMLRSTRLSPVLIGAAVIGIAALIIGARELAYVAGAADTPGYLRMNFFGYQKDHSSPVARVRLMGRAVDGVDAAIERAFWSNAAIVARLEQFKIDADEVNTLFRDNLSLEAVGHFPKLRSRLNGLLDKRDAHFADMAKVKRNVALSRSDPAAGLETLSAEERNIVSLAREIAEATFADGGTTPSGATHQRAAERRDSALQKFSVYQDAYLNPVFSTATLRIVVQDALKAPIEQYQMLLAGYLQELADARQGPLAAEIRRKKIDPLLGTTRDNAMRWFAPKVTPREEKEKQLQAITRGRGNDDQLLAAIMSAYLDPEISSRAIAGAITNYSSPIRQR